MDEQQRERPSSFSAHVPEVQVDAIHLAQKAGVSVELLLARPPIERCLPVLAQLTDVRWVGSVVPSGAGNRFDPPCSFEATAEVIEH